MAAEDVPSIERHDQRDFWIWLSCPLFPRRRLRIPLTALALGFQVVPKKSMSCRQWWPYEASLVKFEDAQCCPNTYILLVIIQHSSCQCCTDFLHAKISGDYLPKRSLFFVSSWLGIILTVNRWFLRTSCFTHSTLTSVLPVEGLPFLESSFNSSHFS